jgi:hypothetical protein
MAATLVALAAGGFAHAQGAAQLGAPRPAEGQPALPADGASRPWVAAEYRLPPISVPDDRPFQGGDPLLDLPELPPPGCFTNAELGLIRPHFKNRLIGTVALAGGGTDTVAVPAADLSWTPAPRFDVGYRIPDGAGEILASYRFLMTDGRAEVLGDPGPLLLKSRLDFHVFNFDFANRDPLWKQWRDPFYTHWEMRWRVGVQLATLYFDSRADLPGPAAVLAGAPLEERETNYFIGAGPHAGLELFRTFSFSGLTLYGAVDGSSLYGRVHQTFTEFLPASGFATFGKSQGVAVLGAQLGLAWIPPDSAVRLFLGYQFEQWYQVGRNGDTSPPFGSMGQLTENGIFVRGEFTF